MPIQYGDQRSARRHRRQQTLDMRYRRAIPTASCAQHPEPSRTRPITRSDRQQPGAKLLGGQFGEGRCCLRCGRPVVMSALATNGLIVPPDHASLVGATADAMAAAVLLLFDDTDERHRDGQSARENVQQNFTWAGAAARLEALLRTTRTFSM